MMIRVMLSTKYQVLFIFFFLLASFPFIAVGEDISELELKAKSGDAESQYNLGKKFLTGDSVEPDAKQGCSWTIKAAEQGHARAQNNAGLCCERGWLGGVKDLRQAFVWYEKSANQDQANGLYNLGVFYLEGLGIEKNEDKGIELIRRSAEKGLASAQTDLARMYEKGKVLPTNYEKATFWYKKAADSGNIDAHTALGFIYHEGKGVSQDDSRAFDDFKTAEAIRWIETLYR